MLSPCKLYIYIAAGEEKHPEDHLQSGVCYQEGFLEESSSTEFVFYLKVSQDHSKGVEGGAINFLSPDVGFSYSEAQLGYIGRGYSIDLTARVDQRPSLAQILLEVEWMMNTRDSFWWPRGVLHTNCSHRQRGRQDYCSFFGSVHLLA